MDLNSWTPQDKTRRLATLIAAYLAATAGFICWLGLHWPWYAAILAALVLYAVLYFLASLILRGMFHA